MRNRNILISGASVAGPVLAYWLQQHGFHPTVVERAPTPRTGGQAIDLRGAAREVATRMGILDAVHARHTGARGVSYLNNSGQPALHWPADTLGDSGGVIAEIEILRGDLVEILHAATRDTVEYLFDDSIVDLTQSEDGVTVTFERSGPRSFDLVVGADGLHSKVRRMVFPAKTTTLSDLGYYLSVFRAEAPIELDGWHHMYNMPGTMAGLYPVGHDGTAQHMLYFTSPRLRYDRWDVAEQKSIVRHAFAGQGWQVPRMLERMDNAEDFYFSPARRIEMTHWSHGRTAVVGDAAFAGALGLGTSMAMVGGYVLAGEWRPRTATTTGRSPDTRTRCATTYGATRSYRPVESAASYRKRDKGSGYGTSWCGACWRCPAKGCSPADCRTPQTHSRSGNTVDNRRPCPGERHARRTAR